MPRYLDLDAWPRRAQYAFFRHYDQPFFNVTAPLDATTLRAWVREHDGVSFFAAYLYLSLRVANACEPFRYRLRGDRVLVHEHVDAGSTVLLPDDTFGFGYFAFSERFAPFRRTLDAEVGRLRGGGPRLDARDDRDDLIHYSVLPWVAFTSFSHARRHIADDSIPKMVFGKAHTLDGRLQLPLSVEVHHSLMDGLHVGRYFEKLQAAFDAPESMLDG